MSLKANETQAGSFRAMTVALRSQLTLKTDGMTQCTGMKNGPSVSFSRMGASTCLNTAFYRLFKGQAAISSSEVERLGGSMTVLFSMTWHTRSLQRVLGESSARICGLSLCAPSRKRH